jgi:hypothetical protein
MFMRDDLLVKLLLIITPYHHNKSSKIMWENVVVLKGLLYCPGMQRITGAGGREGSCPLKDSI